MATKTFEELKQLAIQIRDEKTNKANTATRIGTQMIEHLNKLEQEYYNKDGVAEQLKTRDDELARLDKMTTEYNVSVLHPTSGSGGSNKYTHETAIAQVPSKYRSVGLKCSFINSAGKAECWKYQGGSWVVGSFVPVEVINELNISFLYPTNGVGGTNKYDLATAITRVPAEYRTIQGLKITFINNATSKTETWKYDGGTFTTTTNWKQGDGSGGNLILDWNTDVATTRKQVKQSERKSLLKISYTDGNGNTVNEQYIGTLLTDSEWALDENWETTLDKVKLKINSIKELSSEDLITNGAISSTGIFTPGDYGYVTDFIEANYYEDYKGNYIDFEGQQPIDNSYRNIAIFYNSNKKVINVSRKASDYNYDAKFIRFYCVTKYKNNFYVKVGKISTVEDDVAYQNLLPYVYKTEVLNEININDLESFSGYYLNNNGVIAKGDSKYSVYYKKFTTNTLVRITQSVQSPNMRVNVAVNSVSINTNPPSPKFFINWIAGEIKEFWVPTDFYLQICSPNDESLPTVEILNIDTNTAKSAKTYINIVDKTNLINGRCISSADKTDYAIATTQRTDLIYIGKGVTKLYWRGDTTKVVLDIACVAFLDINKTVIETSQVRTIINVPENAVYVIISYWNDIEFPTVEIDSSEVLSLNSNVVSQDIIALPQYIDIVKSRQTTIYIDGFFAKEDNELINFYLTKLNSNTNVLLYNRRILGINSNNSTDTEIKLSYTKDDKEFMSKNTILRAIDKNVGSGETINILIVGDSLIESGFAAAEVYKLLGEDADYNIVQLGTKQSVGVKHEGRGGWSWSSFIKSGSPFFIDGKLDFKKYIANNFPEVEKIDIIIVALGTNSLGQNPDVTSINAPYKIINIVINDAKTFIDAFFNSETGYPEAKMAVGLIGLGAADTTDAVRERNLKIAYTLLNSAYIENFDNGKYNPNLTTVAHGAYIDRYKGYGVISKNIDDLISDNIVTYPNDFIHPKENGYRQWGRGYYGKIRAFLAGYL